MSTKSRAEIYLHLVWATLRRTPLLIKDVERVAASTIVQRCDELRCDPCAIGLMPDHVHLLVRLHPGVSLAQLVAEVKGLSSHTVTKKFGSQFEWQHGYGAFSISAEDVDSVKSYVVNQKRHHEAKALLEGFEPIYD
jgi:REP element-mobilizing transposase RayT